jgi:tetratricopeptide (TPR) repeat protein
MRYLAKCLPNEAEEWLLRATLEDPSRRENWVDLASYYYNKQYWPECNYAIDRALRITERSLDYISESEAWGAYPHDIGSIAAWHIGLYEQAIERVQQAIALDPSNGRIRENLQWMTSNLHNKTHH